MIIKAKKPPIVHLLRLKFPEIVKDRVIMVWGENVYTKYPLNKWLVVHEGIHIKQQKGNWFGGLIWWIKYICSAKFRLKMEIEAYKAQYKSFCQDISKPRHREEFLNEIAGDLAGPIYGKITNLNKAKELIKHG